MPAAPKTTSARPRFVVRSGPLATDYCVYVADPGGRGVGPLPAVVLFDGDYLFDPVVDVYRALRSEGAVAPALIVGLGYGKPFGDPENRRGRDYTPAAGPEEPGSGGAGPFLREFTAAIWPEIARRCSADSQASVFAGHSLGGLFALYALFQIKPLFSRALVGAPSLWWADRAFLTQLAAFRDRRETLPVQLFLGVGEDETPSMLSDLALLREQLDSHPFAGLRVTRKTFPGRDRYNVVPDLFRAGLPIFLSGRIPP